MYQTNFKFEWCRVQESNLHWSFHGVLSPLSGKEKPSISIEMLVYFVNFNSSNSIRIRMPL